MDNGEKESIERWGKERKKNSKPTQEQRKPKQGWSSQLTTSKITKWKKQRSDCSAPSWDWGLRDFFSFRWSFLHLLFFTAIISSLHTHYNWSHSSPQQGHISDHWTPQPLASPWNQQDSQKGHPPLPSPLPSCLVTEEFPGIKRVPSTLNLSLHPCVLSGVGFQTTGQVSLKSIAVKSSRILGPVSLGAFLQL